VAETVLISIVDDDESVGRAIRRLVASAGLRAEMFLSAEAFLGSTACEETACLILDLRLPGMSGLELQTRLAAVRPGLPIVFISAHSGEDVRARALSAGAGAFLSKPFQHEDLLNAVRCALAAATRQDGGSPCTPQEPPPA